MLALNKIVACALLAASLICNWPQSGAPTALVPFAKTSVLDAARADLADFLFCLAYCALRARLLMTTIRRDWHWKNINRPALMDGWSFFSCDGPPHLSREGKTNKKSIFKSNWDADLVFEGLANGGTNSWSMASPAGLSSMSFGSLIWPRQILNWIDWFGSSNFGWFECLIENFK